MVTPESLYRFPNAVAADYSRFRVSERLLLSGHSHQAWPDCSLQAQQQSWLDAAEHVDGKWEKAFAQAEAVRRGYARLLDDTEGYVGLAESTHSLLTRWISALPLDRRPRLVTTDGEFHTIRRQLDRLGEERWVEVVRVAAQPAATLPARLAAAVDDRTAAVLVSKVLYRTAHILPPLNDLMRACQRVGAELLVDAYHVLGAVPFSIRSEGLEGAYVTGGGYKYLQLGEGNCFLRYPSKCAMRPLITGWYAEFDTLTGHHAPGEVRYGDGPNRFAGATYDPASHYRAAEVFAFFERKGFGPQLLREVSQHQVARLAERFDALDVDPAVITRDRSVGLEHIAGFLSLLSPRAGEFCRELGRRGVYADFRDDVLRLGPAPYLCDRQLDLAIDILGQISAGTA